MFPKTLPLRLVVLIPLLLGLGLPACDLEEEPTDDGENGDVTPEECPEPEELGGYVRSDLTLSGHAECVDFHLTSNLTVSDDAVLAIEPGVTILVDEGLSINIDRTGVLAAVGSPSAKVTFTAGTELGWRGIVFHNSYRTENRLEHVVVERAGSRASTFANEAACVSLTTNQPDPVRVSILNTTIRNCLANGLDLAWNAILSEFSDNIITENAGVPVFTQSPTVAYLDAGTQYTGNDDDVIHVETRTLESDAVWATFDVPVRIHGELRLDARFELGPGARLLFRPETSLIVRSEGVLVAQGSEDAPVLLTADDVELGWKGVNIYNSISTDNLLDHVIIEYGGSATFSHAREAANLVLTTNQQSPVRVSVTNTVLRNSLGNGFELTETAVVPDFSNNVVTANQDRAGYLSARVAHWLDDSTTYVGNGEDSVFVRSGGRMEDDVVWQAIDADYLIDGKVLVYGYLGIEPGARLVFRNDSRLAFYSEDGILSAVGNPEAPIIFTAAVPTPGYWQGLGFVNAVSPDNELRHVVVEYGGGGGLPHEYAATNISVSHNNSSTPSRLTISHATISHSGGCGIAIQKESAAITSLDMDTIVFADNAAGNVCQQQ